MNIIRDDIWPTPIWSFDLPCNAVDLKEIEKECRNIQQTDIEGRKISNINGWQSNNIITKLPTGINNFKNFIESISNSWFEDLGIKPIFSKKMSALWINFNYQGSYNIEHIHGGSIFSGTFYVKSNSESGKILFSDNSDRRFINQSFTELNNRYTFEKVWYPNTPGKVIIFPSWVQHSVEQNMSNEERISIAFNF
jgi:uncharacterized protein (TIGR02466 family)